ncbi:aspartic and glutamic acid-rich protein-like [Procambarus clarkii]|uniref:aspartic and glutamic acid-rich protein-like n=1 Tax=Procambarus clarkii TaxID=6728 RepID=UPI0037443391
MASASRSDDRPRSARRSSRPLTEDEITRNLFPDGDESDIDDSDFDHDYTQPSEVDTTDDECEHAGSTRARPSISPMPPRPHSTPISARPHSSCAPLQDIDVLLDDSEEDIFPDKGADMCEMDYFTAYFDEPLMEHLVQETNKYASDLIDEEELSDFSRLQRWKDTTVGEMFIKVHGERQSADIVGADEYVSKFAEMVQEQNLSSEQIYNADETDNTKKWLEKLWPTSSLFPDEDDEADFEGFAVKKVSEKKKLREELLAYVKGIKSPELRAELVTETIEDDIDRWIDFDEEAPNNQNMTNDEIIELVCTAKKPDECNEEDGEEEEEDEETLKENWTENLESQSSNVEGHSVEVHKNEGKNEEINIVEQTGDMNKERKNEMNENTNEKDESNKEKELDFEGFEPGSEVSIVEEIVTLGWKLGLKLDGADEELV